MSKLLNQTGLSYFWGKIKSYVDAGLNGKVTAVSGKTLTTNDLTDALKNNYDASYTHATSAHAPSTAQANVIEGITVNGATMSPTNKVVNITVPTTVAALSDAGNYALKSDLTSLYKYMGSVAAVANLPTNATTGDVYNVESDGMNYAWNGTTWDSLGSSIQIEAITNAEIDDIFE